MAEPKNFLGRSAPLVPPLHQSSVYVIPDLDVLDRILNGQEPGFIYARDGHPNARHLAAELALKEGGSWGLTCGSGMAAITTTLLAVTQQGDRIVACNRLYGRTTQLLGQELARFGVRTDFVDSSDPEQVAQALALPARVLFVETLSNPLLRLVDLECLVSLAKSNNCLLVVDNTFATPTLIRPLELGADFVVESLTKMIGGHSDVTLGLVCGRGQQLPALTQVASIWGLASNPFDCWLASRGLATLDLRMRTGSENAARLAEWLVHQSGISRVIYPGLPGHPDYKLAGRLFDRGFGNMLCFEMDGGREAVNRFLHRASGIPFSPSLGHTTTTCSHPASTSHRYVNSSEKKRQGISDGLIRLSVGIEDFLLLQKEMAKGLK